MLGVNDKTWLIDLLCDTSKNTESIECHQNLSKFNNDRRQYLVYFGLGHCIKLYDFPGVFKINLAGIALGNCILKYLRHNEIKGRFLDVGTGSGVLALLTRDIEANNITATDVSENSIELTKENEKYNFNNEKIHITDCP